MTISNLQSINISDLIDSHEKYQLLFNEMNSGFATHEIILDAQGKPINYKFLSINPEFERLTGLKASETVGKTALEVVPKLESYWIDIYGDVAISGKSIEFENFSEGLKKYFKIHAFSYKKGFFAVIFEDISEKILAEKEKSKVQAKLFHSEKLASIGTLASGIAHEINNPLTIIKGYVSLLHECVDNHSLPDNEEIKNILQKQESALNRITNIVDNLRKYSREDSNIVEDIDINEAIQETINLCSSIYGKSGVNILTSYSAKNPWVKGNSGKLQQVIFNLLSNAKDAIELKHVPGIIKIHTFNVANSLCIEISDNGTGIDEKIIKKIFDPFFTTKPIGKGTGLGLSISHSIISSFEGNMQIESEPGKETKVSISIPSTEHVFTPIHESNCKNFVELKLQGKILIVDDEPEILQLVKKYLRSLSMQVVLASNGYEALEKMREDDFEYLISDIKMPVMNGHDMLLEMKKSNRKNPKILFMTGCIVNDFSPSQLALIQENSLGIIKKPFSKETLIDAIYANPIDEKFIN